LAEHTFFPEHREYTGRFRIDEIREFDRTLGSIVKACVKPESRQHLDLADAPRRGCLNWWRYLNGAIFFGVCIRAHNYQFSISSSR
jgi:hypothetical protein